MATNNSINNPVPTPIAGGGTGVTSVTIAATATAFAGWDANKNLSANAFIPAYTTTATAAGTTVLTVGSTEVQFFTGVTTQTVTLPVTSTLVLGQHFYIVNNSSGSVTINSSGGNAVQVMAAGTTCNLTCILTSGTTAASWYAEYAFQSGSSSGTVNSGSINQLAWYAANGTAVSGLATVNSGTLTTNAAGVPTWLTKVAITQVVRQVFTSSGTYTPTTGMAYCDIEALGSGGGGGGVPNSGATASLSAGGGGAGSYSKKISTAAAIGASQTVTIGNAGTGGANTGGNGVAGSDCSLGTICIGKGGSGGIGGGLGAGGAGGVAGTGDVTTVGNNGGQGGNNSIITVTITQGIGAPSIYGGSPGVVLTPAGVGVAASLYGAGGNGASSFGAGGAAIGGAGSKGIVIVTEYISI